MSGVEHVTIAVDRQNPPYAWEEWGELRGATVDLLRRVFTVQHVAVTLHAVDGPMAQAIQVSAGLTDAAADFTITARRQRWFHFSQPYNMEELQVYALRHGPIWPGWRTFRGVLGVKSNSYAHEFLIRHHHTVRLALVDSTERLLESLREQQVQGIVMSRVTGTALLAESTEIGPAGVPFGPAPLALAALPGHEDALDAFNAGLRIVGGEQEILSPFAPRSDSAVPGEDPQRTTRG